MPPTEENIGQPVSPEMVAGGSYLPQEDQQVPSMPNYDPSVLGGQASDVNDAFLSMNGVINGDPVGMETFDLGFFEDGTPAITINGANIPIQHNQWMALLTQRQKARAEVKARMQFEVEKRKAKTGITKILASAPSIPPQLGQLLMTIADMDPGTAMQETQQLLVSMARDNGRQQIGKLSTMIQDNAVAAEASRLTREMDVQIGESEFGEPIMAKTSPARARAAELSRDGDPRKRKTAYAISNIESLFPPKGMKSDPTVNGKPIGIFDIMVGLDGGDTSELSRFELLRNLAAYSDLWPSKVDWVDTPNNMGGFVGPSTGGPIDYGMAPQSYARFRNYLLELDQWASSALKWDRSDPQSIDMIMQQALSTSRMPYNQPAPQQQGTAAPATQESSGNSFNIDFDS
jgi:hypothetical protein